MNGEAPEMPVYGQPVQMQPGLVRIVAPNPSAMTHWGTNTYVLGTHDLCIMDPGPDDPVHLAALLAHIDGRRVSHIVVTHSHLDHSGLSVALSRATGARVLAFGHSSAGRSAVMSAFDHATGGEGVDHAFAPDRTLPDGAVLAGPDWQLSVLHTPGHMGNHICLQCDNVIFSGDLVMGWASSMVSPPDGDLTDFRASCRRLAAVGAARLYPGHGAPVLQPAARIGWLLNHRMAREAQILAALAQGPQTVAALTATVYTDTPPALHPAVARNVLAHLVDLVGRNLVTATPALRADAVFART